MSEFNGTLTFERHIKAKFLAHLRILGFLETEQGLQPPDNGKERIRALHQLQRHEVLDRERAFIERELVNLSVHFANGSEVSPKQIRPKLEIVHADTWQSRLFRLAGLLWSVPVSQGYGRRIRFLVWDDQNSKLIGLIALGDPVFNLKVRDTAIGWDAEDRRDRLVNVMDAYVLGAVPPYNRLLGGKLVAAMLRTKDVRDAFRHKYSGHVGVISGQTKRASLVLITTSSALGRSSVYNRVALDGTRYLQSVGFTSGWGHFHVPGMLFDLIRKYLSARDHAYTDNHRFGDGPNWKLRATRQGLTMLGLEPNLLRHGIRREVFLCSLAKNAHSVLRGSAIRPDYSGLLTAEEVGAAAVARWIVPRGNSDSSYLEWTADQLRQMLAIEQGQEVRARVSGQL